MIGPEGSSFSFLLLVHRKPNMSPPTYTTHTVSQSTINPPPSHITDKTSTIENELSSSTHSNLVLPSFTLKIRYMPPSRLHLFLGTSIQRKYPSNHPSITIHPISPLPTGPGWCRGRYGMASWWDIGFPAIHTMG